VIVGSGSLWTTSRIGNPTGGRAVHTTPADPPAAPCTADAADTSQPDVLTVEIMLVLRSILLFVLVALAETGGA
jgi:hypothetical protein